MVKENNISPHNQNGNSNLSRRKASGQLIGNMAMLIAAIMWGLNVTVTKALIPEWMSAVGIVFSRLVGGCLLFWLVSFFFKTERISRHDMPRVAIAGMVGLAGFIYLFVKSLAYANPIDVSIIMTLPPSMVIIFGALFLKRRPSMLEIVGVIVSLAAAIVLILDGGKGKAGSDETVGNLLAIASAACYAAYLLLIEKPSATYSPVSLLRWIFLWAAIPGLALLPGLDKMPLLHTSNPMPWLEIIFIVVGPTFLAYFLVQPAMKLIGSEMVSLYQYLVPVVATISAVTIGLDRLRIMQVVAMAVVIIGMIITNAGKRRKTNPPIDKPKE